MGETEPDNTWSGSQTHYRVWVKRDFPYRVPSFDYLQTSPNDRYILRQCVNLYLPMHSWTTREQEAIHEQVNRFEKQCWSRKQYPRKRNDPWMDIVRVGERLLIVYCVGGSWMICHRAQRNVHEILKSLCCKLNAVCVSIGYRVCRMRSTYLDIALLMMSIVCFLAVCILWNASDTYFKVTWMMMGLFFTILLVASQLLRQKPCNMHPTSLVDVTSAVKWSHKFAHVFGADRSKMVLAGHSAGAHEITLLYSDPSYWVRTHIPRSSIRAIVAISGVYSAKHMCSNIMSRTIGNLVFGNNDDHHWSKCFPCEVTTKNGDIQWPHVLLLSAEFDFGLRQHSMEFHHLLSSGNRCKRLEWTTVKSLNHFSISCFWSHQHYPIADYVCQFIKQALYDDNCHFVIVVAYGHGCTRTYSPNHEEFMWVT